MSKEFLKIFEYFEIYEFDINNTEDVKKLIKLLWNECEEKESLRSTLKEIREYINKNCDFNGTAFYDKWVSGKVLLEIINKGIGEDK